MRRLIFDVSMFLVPLPSLKFLDPLLMLPKLNVSDLTGDKLHAMD